MGYRRQGRELALQTLYLQDACDLSLEIALKTSMGDGVTDSVKDFAVHLVNGVLQKKDEIDTIIRRYTQNWDIQRMATVDRNILRIATYEILSDPETPVSVVIDEAIEISKLYSTEDSSKFVNGILDKVKQERPAT
ncbi:MAG: transcription antitermination factor NusB [Elusimicrobia bacterium]|nr:transcription antitermination factor NusB [Elusimicrobiota bacterium]MBI3013308.1 transcription antitermination factor NusB [Elusimicrobiota bacterium]